MDSHNTAAHISAATSGFGAVISFAVEAVPILQIVAVIISIVAGVYSIRLHRKNLGK